IMWQFLWREFILVSICSRIRQMRSLIHLRGNTLLFDQWLTRLQSFSPILSKQLKEHPLSYVLLSMVTMTYLSDFTYRYLRKKSVDWMTIMESSWHSQRPWTRQSSLSIRGDSLRDRDQDRVRWMIECVMYRRRLGIGSGRKAHISDMRKRLNTYAGKERDSYKKGIGHIDEEEEEDHPREMDMDEEEKE
ncbi:hypothetical protein PENTCL1PPCAC_2498, partial [Pristionchus entomophagus]